MLATRARGRPQTVFPQPLRGRRNKGWRSQRIVCEFTRGIRPAQGVAEGRSTRRRVLIGVFTGLSAMLTANNQNIHFGQILNVHEGLHGVRAWRSGFKVLDVGMRSATDPRDYAGSDAGRGRTRAGRAESGGPFA